MSKEKDLIFLHMFGKNYENVWWYRRYINQKEKSEKMNK